MASSPSAAADPAFLPDLSGLQPVFLLVLLGELLAIVLTLAGGGLAPFQWEQLGALSFLIQWIILLSAGGLTLCRPWLDRQSARLAGACSYVLVLGVITLSALSSQWLLASGRGLDGDALLTTVLIGAIVSGVALRYLYLQQQLTLQKQAELRARIAALQARIRPHFLFNGMNTIASLIATDPDKAEAMVVDLASLFRASLAEPALVSLRDELTLCRHYLAIEQTRLGPRLQVEWQVDESLLEQPLPSLLLQPIVENAVYHGIQPLPAGGRVLIVIQRQILRGAAQLVIEVRNPLPAPGGSHRQGNRIALDNIERRLQALYGEGARLDLARDDHEFSAVVRMPLAAGS